MTKKFKPMHPGEVLREEFLIPMGITAYRLAKDIRVQPTRISLILRGKAGISADTALRLGRYFQMSAQFWLNLQAHYDLELASDRQQRRIEREVAVYAA
jgi:addiction module HigA family antidote